MKKVLVTLLTLIFIISIISTVYAATGSITLSASQDTVVKGKTFTVTVAGTADNNITALQANLSYDTSKLSIESKTVGTGFSDLSGTNEIAIASTDNSSLAKQTTLYTITFKVLDEATEGTATISLTNATLALVNESATQENVNVSDASVTVTIKSDSTTAENNKNTIENNVNANGTTTPSTTKSNKATSNNSNSSNSSTSSATKKLPQTGIESTGILAIVVLSVVSIVSYISYRKYKNV